MPSTAYQMIEEECAGVSRAMGLLTPADNERLACDVQEYVTEYGTEGNSIATMWAWVMGHILPETSEDYAITAVACIATAYAECGTCHGSGIDPDGGECGPESWSTPCACWVGDLLGDDDRAALHRMAAARRNAAHRGVDAATRPVALGTVKMRRAW